MEMETLGWRGVNCCDYSVSPTEAVPEAISVLVDMQQQGLVLISVAHISTRDYGPPLLWAATWEHVDVQWQCRIDPTPHRLLHSVE